MRDFFDASRIFFGEKSPLSARSVRGAENCTLAVFHRLACGVGHHEVIDDGKSGLLVSAGDASALALSMIGLLQDEPKRHAMALAARNRVRRDFSFAAMSKQYHELFKKVMSSQCSTGR